MSGLGIKTCADLVTTIASATVTAAVCDDVALTKFDNKAQLFLYECNIYGQSLKACFDFDTRLGAGVIEAITSSTIVQTVISTTDVTLYTQYNCYGTN